MEAAGARRPRAGKTSLRACQTWGMAHGLLLLAAVLPLVGLSGLATSHVRNGLIVYAHGGPGRGTNIYTIAATGRTGAI